MQFLCIYASISTNCRSCSTVVFTFGEKNLHVSETAQFKPVLFKDQMYFQVSRNQGVNIFGEAIILPATLSVQWLLHFSTMEAVRDCSVEPKRSSESQKESFIIFLIYLLLALLNVAGWNDYLARGTKLFWLFLTQRTIKSKNTRVIKTRLINYSVQLFCFQLLSLYRQEYLLERN